MDKGIWNTVGVFVAIVTSIFSLFHANQANRIARESNDIGKSTFLMNDDKFTIKIAYAYPLNKTASLNLTSIAKQIAAEEKEEIDLLKTPERAGEILGFVETAYQFSCKTVDGIDYDFSFFIDRDMQNNGRLEHRHFYYTRDEFNRRSEKASLKAGKNVLIIKSQ